MQLQLSKRLKAVSDMVTSGCRLADVGTDHGYIPLWLTEQKRISGAIAMDINQGPLLRAEENIRLYGYEDKIETRLSDGVSALKPGETDSVVIAGMGGGLVMKILKEGAEVLKSVSELILQPQSDIEKVRRFLQQENYCINLENMILEDGKFYPVMRAVHGAMEELRDIDYRYGPCLLKEKNQCLKFYLDKEEETYQTIIRKLLNNKTETAAKRMSDITKELKEVKRAKEEMV